MARVTFAVVLTLAAAGAAAPGPAPARSADALRANAYDTAYNLDYERAVDLLHQAVDAAPDDIATLRAVASIAWLRILFLRGTVLVEDYMGHIRSSDTVKMPDPPADLDKTFQDHIGKAIALSEKAVDQRYADASSHYDLSSSLGIAASYAGTIRGSLWSAMRLARRSYSEGEMVLQLDPRRKEAGLIVGTYRYLVSQLPGSVRWMAYIIGFGGGREEGLRLISEASKTPSDIQTDAQFALVLLHNREKKYDEALGAIRGLERSFPRNRLLQLEEASTLLRAGRAADALAVLDAAMARLPNDSRQRMPGEEGRWLLKRGVARQQVGMLTEAEADLKGALACADLRTWVKAQIHIELGKVADLRGDRTKAKAEYQAGLTLALASGDESASQEATRLQSQAYRK
jgi:tetratricopeptide (TPR) repeat protein